MAYSHQLYMVWLVGVLVKSYTYRAHLENVSRAHTITCYTRDGADMHLFCDLTARTPPAGAHCTFLLYAVPPKGPGGGGGT